MYLLPSADLDVSVGEWGEPAPLPAPSGSEVVGFIDDEY